MGFGGGVVGADDLKFSLETIFLKCLGIESVRGSDPMKKRFGHPLFYQLTREEEKLYNLKNHDYAAGGNPSGNFERVAAIKRLYPNVDWSSPVGVASTYLLKQLDAAFWLLSSKHRPKVEGPSQRFQDISIYSKIIMILLAEEKEANKRCRHFI